MKQREYCTLEYPDRNLGESGIGINLLPVINVVHMLYTQTQKGRIIAENHRIMEAMEIETVKGKDFGKTKTLFLFIHKIADFRYSSRQHELLFWRHAK